MSRLGAAAVAVLVALLVPSAALADRYDDTVITVTYTGTLKTVRNNQITAPLVTQVDWDLTWTGKVHDLEHTPQHFTVRKLSGATAATVPGNAALSCSATLSRRAGKWIPVSGGRPPAGTLLTAHAFAPITAEELRNDDASPGHVCDTYPGIYGSSPNLQPKVELNLGGAIAAVKKSFAAKYDGPAGSGRETDTLASTLELRIGRASGSGGTQAGPSTPEAVRRVAKKALIWDVPMAGYSCFMAGTGVVVLGTSGPAIGLLIGPTLTGVAGPVCARMIQAIKRFARTYDDPPVAHFDRIAGVRRRPPPQLHLPDCSGSDPAVCERLTATARTYVAAVQRVADVASTLATTVGRESAARKAGHTASANRQARRAIQLVPILRKAARAQSTAGAAFAAALRAAGAAGQMTVDQRAAGNEAVLRRLVEIGVPRAETTAIAGAALTPTALDPLAALGSKL